MKKKVFFVITSLGAGGSEKVFWLLTQYFAKPEYAVSVVIFDKEVTCFSTALDGVNFIDLKTKKASKSFLSLYKLLKKEKPYAVFSTTDHINVLVSMVSYFVKIPRLIARVSNNIDQMKAFTDYKDQFYRTFNKLFYPRFDSIVCQSEEMKNSFLKEIKMDDKKIFVIPNPILKNKILKNEEQSAKKRLIMVARLSKEKGISRMIDIVKLLPDHYHLSIAGDGPIFNEIKNKINYLHLENRIALLGKVDHISDLLASYDLMVLSSYTEGFPNAVLEALGVGLPVVSFRVGGITDLILNDFNGFILEQDDELGFAGKIISACSKSWDHQTIKTNIYKKYELNKIGESYEMLLTKG